MITWWLLVVSILGTLSLSVRRGSLDVATVASLVFTLGFPVRILAISQGGDLSVFSGRAELPAKDQASFEIALFFAYALYYLFASRSSQVSCKEPGNWKLGVRPPVQSNYVRLLFVASLLIAVQVGVLSVSFGGVADAISVLSRRNFVEQSIGFASNLSFPILTLIIGQLRHSGVRKSIIVWLATIVEVSLAFFIAMIVNGRAFFVAAILSVLFALRCQSRRRFSVWAVILAAGATLGAAVAGLAWRTAAQQQIRFTEAFTSQEAGPFTVLSDSLPLFDHLVVAYQYVQWNGHQVLFLLDSFTVLIPRSLWPTKPVFLPQLIGVEVGGSALSGLPAGLAGEGYIAYGLIGVVLFYGVFGFVIAWSSRLLNSGRLPEPMWCWMTVMAIFVSLTGQRTGAQGAIIALQTSAVFLPVIFFAFAGSGERGDRTRSCFPVAGAKH